LRRIAANLLVLLVTLAVVAGLGEAVVRSLPQRRDLVERAGRLKARFNPYRADGVLGHSLRSDWETVHATRDFHVTVRTNELGLRGEPAAPAKTAGTFRVLVVGDSFAFGFGVEDEESFPALLETRLDTRFERPVEVLNAGVPGWSTDHYLLFLRTRGFALEPDLVVLAIMENDVGDLAWNRLILDEERLPVRIESLRRLIDHRGRMRYVEGSPLAVPALEFPGRLWLADHSALYHWLRFRLVRAWTRLAKGTEQRRRRREAGPPPEGAIATLSSGEIQSGLASGPEFRLRYHRHLVQALERDCRQRGVESFFLLVANRDSDPAPGSAAAALHRDCAARGDACLDTAKLFAPERSVRAFFPHDPHWNGFGHAQVAQALAERLSRFVR
jgi:hypothetical protein